MGKTDQELLERLKREPHLREVSTFADEATAEQVIKAAIAKHEDRIRKWLMASGNADLQIDYSSSELLGRTLSRNTGTAQERKNAFVLLRKATNGYYVQTAYVR